MLSRLRRSGFASAAKRLVRQGDEWAAGRRAAQTGWMPRVLFQASNVFGYDAQEPVIRALAARGRVAVQVAGGNECGLLPERIRELDRIGATHCSLRVARHRRYDAIVFTDVPLVRYWRGGRRIYLHHGSSFATRDSHYAFDLMREGVVEYLLALHETEVTRGREIFGATFHAAVVGQPKLDRLLGLAGARGATLNALGLDPSRPTVIVMSHWTPTSLLESCGEEVLRVLEARRELNVLVTGHHQLWSPRPGSADWRSRLAWVDSAPHMRLLPARDDLAALMAAADVAITDHTSATLEYAALYRPMVLFRHPSHPFTEPEIDARLRGTSNVFAAASEFPVAFERAMAPGGVDPAGRDGLLRECFAHLGDSARHAAIAVEQVAWSGGFSEPPAAE